MNHLQEIILTVLLCFQFFATYMCRREGYRNGFRDGVASVLTKLTASNAPNDESRGAK